MESVSIKIIRQITQRWEDLYGGAELAVSWEETRALIRLILQICLYAENAIKDALEDILERANHSLFK